MNQITKVALVAISTIAIGASVSLYAVGQTNPTHLLKTPHERSQKAAHEAMDALEGTISDWNVATYSLELTASYITSQGG